MTINFDFLPQIAYAFMVVFARVGAMLMVLPILGETSFPMRLRLVFALMLTLILYPALSSTLPPFPGNIYAGVELMIAELALGIAIGLVVRLVMSAIQVAGTAIAFQTGLAFAMNVDPSQGIQSAIFSSFLSMTAIAVIFLTDLHHLLIVAIVESYTMFQPGNLIPIGDFAEMATQTVANSFAVAIQIAAPFLAFGLLFYLGVGVLSRLMPQVQIFFVIMPVNIFLGFVLFALLLSVMVKMFVEHFESTVRIFLG